MCNFNFNCAAASKPPGENTKVELKGGKVELNSACCMEVRTKYGTQYSILCTLVWARQRSKIDTRVCILDWMNTDYSIHFVF